MKLIEGLEKFFHSTDGLNKTNYRDFQFFRMRPCKIPKRFSEKEYAQVLLECCRDYANGLNKSTDVFDFSSGYISVKESLEELAYLNEKKKVFMYPTPRQNFQKIYGNIENTINDFISRSISQIRKTGIEWAEDVDFLIWEIEKSDCFNALLTEKNRERILKIKREAKEILSQKEKIEPEETSSSQIIDLSKVDYEQIINDEMAWRREQMGLPSTEYELRKIDGMDGHAFEHWCAELLRKNGFVDVEVTKGSGDQGVDVLAVKDGIRYAIQCKCYSSNLGNGPVQEVNAGKALYHCHVGVVMTNQYFTAGAKELATATGVLLWDRDKLEEMLTTAAP